MKIMKTYLRWMVTVVAGFVLLPLVFAGCGSKNDESGSSSTNAPSTGSTGAPAPATGNAGGSGAARMPGSGEASQTGAPRQAVPGGYPYAQGAPKR